MYFMLAQMNATLSSCTGNSSSRVDRNSLPQSSFRLQIDVRIQANDGVNNGHKILFDTGVRVDHQDVQNFRTGAIEVDVPPHECLTTAIHEILTGITATTIRTEAVPQAAPRDVLQHGSLRIDLRTREVSVKGTHVRLTRKEFDLLHHLASHPKQVIRREQIMADIWGNGEMNTPPSRAMRTIDTHVNSLRGKLGCRTLIETVRGVGFRFMGAAETLPSPIGSG
ncbi:MAG TPA: winged helix-turn-helix domain-containing protein [Streptomyces sp.]